MLKNKKIYISVCVVFFSIIVLEFLNAKKPKHPFSGLNTVELIKEYGYPVETHEVITEDGYILTLHRIPHGRSDSKKKKTPILFIHGLLHSGVDFIVLGPDKALGLLLADEGFDIWLGNVRGTTWSRKHQTLNPDKDKDFWNFSFHEVGTYDIKAFIDYILEQTGSRDLHYVGFSQGTITFFILTSERPEYASKIKLMTALAPAVFLKGPKGLFLSTMVLLKHFVEKFFYVFNFNELLSENDFLGKYLRTICNENSMFVSLCLFHVYSLQGYNYEGTNKSTLSLFYTNVPAGVSMYQLVHVLHLMDSGNFQKYDFGTNGNLQKYGQEEPPTYDLSTAVTPVALYYSTNDWIVNMRNMEKVTKTLPNVVKSYHVPLEKFNHDNFVHSDDAAQVVYKAVIEEILKYN